MKSISLNFKGPFHHSQFINKDKNKLPEGSELPGVYIWGFMINDNFIPYYVGKHQKSIAYRIQNHISDITKHNSTYMRLNKAYMEGLNGINPYYKDVNFPLITANWSKEKLPKWFIVDKDYFNTRISYLNNREFLLIYEINIPNRQKDYPISLLKSADNYLNNNIDKLHVMYSDCVHNHPEIKQSEYYELIEAFTKYYLRGKTVSKSLPFMSIDKLLKLNGLDEIVITNISKIGSVFKNGISNDFPGY